MATALSIAAMSLLTLANAAAIPPLRGIPPIGVTVVVAPEVPARLVSMLLAETDAIWRPTGITFVWQRESSTIPTKLRVTIDDARRPEKAGDWALGWVAFDDDVSPTPDVHLSYASAFDLMMDSRGIIGPVDRMPLLERNTYLARALGRALAHELGHYLLASKAHTKVGLMQTHRSAIDLFGVARSHFDVSADQRALVAARLDPAIVVGSR
jgi:hypothetical protein